MSDLRLRLPRSGTERPGWRPAPAQTAGGPDRGEWDDLPIDAASRAVLRRLLPRLRARHKNLGRRRHGPNPWRYCQLLFLAGDAAQWGLAAQLLARELGVDYLPVSVAALRSRRSPETRCNIGRVFRRAGRAVLLFDEADVLFGRRTAVDTPADRYGNREVAYLLQCAETYAGVVILACTRQLPLRLWVKRRFLAVVRFADPGPQSPTTRR